MASGLLAWAVREGVVVLQRDFDDLDGRMLVVREGLREHLALELRDRDDPANDHVAARDDEDSDRNLAIVRVEPHSEPF